MQIKCINTTIIMTVFTPLLHNYHITTLLHHEYITITLLQYNNYFYYFANVHPKLKARVSSHWRSWQCDREDGTLSHLQLVGAALAAHHVAAGAEGGVDLLLAAHHAQQRLAQLLQPLLQCPALLAASAVQAVVLLAAARRVRRRRGRVHAAAAGSRGQFRHARVVEGAAGVVVNLLGGAADIEDVLLAQVDVVVEEERRKVALEVAAVLHHHGVGHRVAPAGGRVNNS